MNQPEKAFLHPARLDLMFTECADRENCKIFYGHNAFMQPWACYFFDRSDHFERAQLLMRSLATSTHFESMESISRSLTSDGGTIYVRRPKGQPFSKCLPELSRTQQLKTCLRLLNGLVALHRLGASHGALDEDNVVFDEATEQPVIQEAMADFDNHTILPPFCAPEQYLGGDVTWATDVFQFAAGYLTCIKAPSSKLNQLIQNATQSQPNLRPTAEEMHRVLESIVALEATESFWPQIRFKPNLILPYSLCAILFIAAFWRFSHQGPSEPNIQISKITDHNLTDGVDRQTATLASFAQALTVVTGKPVRYPSQLATQPVAYGDSHESWEEVLSSMGLSWEIRIIKKDAD